MSREAGMRGGGPANLVEGLPRWGSRNAGQVDAYAVRILAKARSAPEVTFDSGQPPSQQPATTELLLRSGRGLR